MTEPEATNSLSSAPSALTGTGAYSLQDSAAELVRLLDCYLADLQAGRAVDRPKLIADHPALASQLEQCLAGIEFIHKANRTAAEAPAQLGDFRIVREIGRGGMGVVYEAEQISLKRRVALKVLGFGVVVDAEAMQRFQREAETVAKLHHTNIVPIFAIGCENGVHYFVMQFIAGISLAVRLEMARREGASLAATEVAHWGLQAAEALAHAHQRGVIHRDIKPSNLLLDDEGTLWLTDFGLAKRVDEVTLTAAGILLGTPRYMSPEQASAVKQPVDQRTDIYSLGATLYELATGRPVCDGQTAQAVLSQILHAEPPAPRLVQPGLPRDLETILLRCLEKEAARRYPTAQVLTDDLRAFLEGRAIKARRPNLAERAVRWARKERRNVRVAGLAAVASTLLLVGIILGWGFYRESQLGRVLFTTGEAYVSAEFLKEDRDEVVNGPFSLPTQQPVALPAGNYRVRLSAPGLLSETYQLFVERGAERQFKVGLAERRLWEPIAIDHPTILEVVCFAERSDLVQVRFESMRRLHGATGHPMWEIDLASAAKGGGVIQTVPGRSVAKDPAPRPPPPSQKVPDLVWSTFFHYSQLHNPPALVQPAPDLDGDGVGDLVWASRNSTSLWAFSGKGNNEKGKELWRFHTCPVADGVDASKVRPSGNSGGGAVVGQPAVVQDVDGDDTPDLIATFVSKGEAVEAEGNPAFRVMAKPQKWIEAISGRTGTSIWRYQLNDAWFKPPRGSSRGTLFAARVVDVRNEPMVVMLAGTRLVLLDARTGKLSWCHDLGLLAIQEPRIADLDGDGQPDVVLLCDKDPPGRLLTAISLAQRRILWEKPVVVGYEPYGMDPPLLDWPVVIDLDHDGKAEVILPVGNLQAYPHWVGIEVRNGADGEIRWQRALRKGTGHLAQCDRFVVGPDIDGDGCRDLFVASVAQEDPASGSAALFVDALSGKDGHRLWWWNKPLSVFNQVGRLCCCPGGPDGGSQLLVPVLKGLNPEGVSVLSVRTGRLLHSLPGAFDPRVADLDGDGIPDLYYRCRDVRTGGVKLCALRGRPPEAWRRLGIWQPAEDFDGDGITDLINREDDLMIAISGRTGAKLWQAPLLPDGSVKPLQRSPIPAPPPSGDLEGNGTPALLLSSPAGGAHTGTNYERVPFPLLALSGKTGKRLWQTEDMILRGNPQPAVAYPMEPRCAPFESKNQPDVIVPFVLDGAGSVQSSLWLARLSGADGRFVWRKQLSEVNHSLCPPVTPALADLDGDGVLDVILCVPVFREDRQVAIELHAYSGRDGGLLWPPRLLTTWANDPWRRLPIPVVGDLDGDGAPEVVVMYDVVEQGADKTAGRQGYLEVVALKGKDGRPKWKPWRARDDRVSFSIGLPGPLLVNLDGDGRRAIALTIEADKKHELVLLDSHGSLRERTTVQPLPTAHAAVQPRTLWSYDLTGNGKEALLFVDRSKVRATQGGFDRGMWEWPKPKGECRIVSIQPATHEHGPIVQVASALGAVHGLDGRTGQPLWQCQDFSVFHDGTNYAFLRTDDSQGLPGVVSWSNETTVCRLPIPLSSAGDLQPMAQPVFESGQDDPRLLKRLPWSSVAQRLHLPWQLVFSTSVVLLAGWLGLWAVRRRSWKLGLLLVFGIAATGAPVQFGVWGTPNQLPQWPLDVLVLSLAALPLVLFLYSVGWPLLHLRWRQPLWLLVLAVVLASALGGGWLWLDARSLDPEKHYSWDGWYGVWLLGPWATGAFILLALLGQWLLHLGQWALDQLLVGGETPETPGVSARSP